MHEARPCNGHVSEIEGAAAELRNPEGVHIAAQATRHDPGPDEQVAPPVEVLELFLTPFEEVIQHGKAAVEIGCRRRKLVKEAGVTFEEATVLVHGLSSQGVRHPE